MKFSRTTRTVGVVLGALAWGALAPAQDLVHKAPPQEGPVLIENATVHTVSGGTIENGAVLFENGRITGVGQAISGVPGDTHRIDATGLHVYPGLIAANTVMGLVEIGAVRATRDYGETGSITPEVFAAVSVNPDSTLIPVTRSNGIMSCAVMPQGGLIPGRASVIRMDGWTWEDLAVEQDAGLIVNWPSLRIARGWWVTKSEKEQRREIRENLDRIDDVFDQAEAYLSAKDADPTIPSDIRFESMRDAIRNNGRIFIRAQEMEQIQSAVNWASERGYNVVIVGGRDAADVADTLARHDVGVILTGTHRLPKRRDADYDSIFRAPLVLEEAGVRWCMATGGGSFQTPHARNLPYHAASAVAYGLPVEAGIRSITLSAAELLGVDDRLGSIEAGKSATLIVTTGNPMEMTTSVEMAFIDGRKIDLTDKHKALRDKYREKYRQLGVIDEE